MLITKCMKRSCTLSHPSHQTLKTLHGCLLILCFTWEVTKKLYSSTTSALLDSAQWQSTEPNPGGYSALTFRETHACPSKNKSPFLNASSSRFLAFSVVNTAQMWQLEWNSFLDLSSSTKWWLCVQSFFLYSHDDSLIPFFGFRSPLFPFQHFSFNFCIATSVNFQHI